MFDIGWPELFIVALVTIIVVGPKELPRVLRTVTLWIRKMRTMAREFQDGIDDLAREAELDDLRKQVEQSADLDVEDELEKMIDPTGEASGAVREIGASLEEEPDSPSESKKAGNEA